MDPVTKFALARLYQSPDDINTRFFSKANMDALQSDMFQIIKSQTKHQIDRQDDNALLIIMIRIYADHASSDHGKPDAQVKFLNDKVLQACIPQITNGIKMRLTYLKDISKLPVPLARSRNMSTAGMKVGETQFGV